MAGKKAASSKKEKLPIYITPKVVAAYAWLNKKDTMSDKYKITGLLSKKEPGEGRLNYGKDVVDGKTWVKNLLALADSVGAPSKIGADGCHIKDGDKNKNEEFKGFLLINAKSDFRPKVVDTQGKELPKSETVFSGDIVKFGIQPKHHVVNGKNFLSFYIAQVMLIEKGQRNSGLDWGSEDGYVADDDADLAFGEDSGDETASGAPDDDSDF